MNGECAKGQRPFRDQCSQVELTLTGSSCKPYCLVLLCYGPLKQLKGYKTRWKFHLDY